MSKFISFISKFKARVKKRNFRLLRYLRIKKLKILNSRNINNKKTILFWNSGGGGCADLINFDAVISTSIELRGFQTHAVIFDGSYKAYINKDIHTGLEFKNSNKNSKKDFKETKSLIKQFGIKFSKFGDYLTDDLKKEAINIAETVNYKDLEKFEFSGLPIGEYIKSSLVRYLMGHEYDESHKSILKEFCYTAIIQAIVISKVIKKIKPAKVFMSHAIYVDWGVAMRFLVSRKIPVFTFMEGRIPATYYFKKITDHNDISPDKCSNQSWYKEINTNLENDYQFKVDNYLYNRYFKNSASDIKFNLRENESISNFKKRYKLENEKRSIWAIFSHINWDASGDLYGTIYLSFSEWLEKTYEEIIHNKNVVWLIKLHPLETVQSRYNTNKFLKKISKGIIPENIRIIDYDEKLNPFLFQSFIDGGVTVNGTAGLEAVIQGKPIILAGSPSYANRGFTVDCNNQSEYISQLKNAHNIPCLSKKEIELAYKYSYLYYFKKQIRLPIFNDPFQKSQSSFIIQDDKLSDLIPGEEKNLSFICDSIINDKEFILPDAQYPS